MTRTYIAYDSRANFGDTSEASVLEVLDADSEAEAIAEAESDFPGQFAAVYSYRDDGKQLLDEQFVGIACEELRAEFFDED